MVAPAKPLLPGQRYTFQVLPGLHFQSGGVLDGMRQSQFTVSQPAPGELPVALNLTITLPAMGPPPLPPGTQISARLAPQLAGLGLLDAIDEADILDNERRQAALPGPVKGRANRVFEPFDGREVVGRFGWKASTGFCTQMAESSTMWVAPACRAATPSTSRPTSSAACPSIASPRASTWSSTSPPSATWCACASSRTTTARTSPTCTSASTRTPCASSMRT